MNFVLHAAGWLEGGLIAGYENFILDLEMCGMMAKYAQGISLSEEDFAWDTLCRDRAGRPFPRRAAHHAPLRDRLLPAAVFNMDNYEKWEAEGSEDIYKKAGAMWRTMLKEYQAPAIDPSIKDALRNSSTSAAPRFKPAS